MKRNKFFLNNIDYTEDVLWLDSLILSFATIGGVGLSSTSANVSRSEENVEFSGIGDMIATGKLYEYLASVLNEDCNAEIDCQIYEACCGITIDFFLLAKSWIDIPDLCRAEFKLQLNDADATADQCLSEHIPIPISDVGQMNGETFTFGSEIFGMNETRPLYDIESYFDYYTEHCNLEFSSSILQGDYSNLILLNLIGGQGIPFDNGNVNTDISQHTMTPIQQLEELSRLMNLGYLVRDGVLYVERVDFFSTVPPENELFDIHELYRNGCLEKNEPPEFNLVGNGCASFDGRYVDEIADSAPTAFDYQRYNDRIGWNTNGLKTLAGICELDHNFSMTHFTEDGEIIIEDFSGGGYNHSTLKLLDWNGLSNVNGGFVNQFLNDGTDWNYRLQFTENPPAGATSLYTEFWDIARPSEQCEYQVKDFKAIAPEGKFCEWVEKILSLKTNSIAFRTKYGQAIPREIDISFQDCVFTFKEIYINQKSII